MNAAGVEPVADAFSFHCTACGRCCNSPPAMTLDELLHHERLFVGCLAIRREAGGAVTLATQAHDYPSIGACPALAGDGLCGIHQDRKPAMCGAVPLDPRLPQGLQRVVLRRRHAEAVFMQADCLAPGARDGHAPLVDGERIVDAGYLAAFEQASVAFGAEDARWASDVHALLRPELARLPPPRPGGYLALSMVPILLVLARRSEEDRERGRRYAAHQVRLIEANVAAAIRRKVAADRGFTEELRRFAAQYDDFLRAS